MKMSALEQLAKLELDRIARRKQRWTSFKVHARIVAKTLSNVCAYGVAISVLLLCIFSGPLAYDRVRGLENNYTHNLHEQERITVDLRTELAAVEANVAQLNATTERLKSNSIVAVWWPPMCLSNTQIIAQATNVDVEKTLCTDIGTNRSSMYYYSGTVGIITNQ